MLNHGKNIEIQDLAKTILRTAPNTAMRWSKTHGGFANMIYIKTRVDKKRSWLRTQLGLPPAHITERCRVWRFRVRSESTPFFLRAFGSLYHAGTYNMPTQVTLEDLKSMDKDSLENLQEILQSPQPPQEGRTT